MFNEATIINTIAKYERSIAGVKNSYNYGQNPDTLHASQLPAVIHFSPSFEMSPRMHHAVWTTEVTLMSILFVSPREARGGRLKFLENAAIPFGNLWRAKFQDADVVNDILAQSGGVRGFLSEGSYAVGEPFLENGATEYIGWTFTFMFKEN